MPRPAESSLPGLPGGGLAALLMLSACAAPVPGALPAAPADAAVAMPVQATEPTTNTNTTAAAIAPGQALLAVLAYADKVRNLPPPQWQTELERVRQVQAPVAWLQMALLHAHRQPPELARALELATQVQQDGSPQGQQLQSLARVLAHRWAEQRRLEELLERQSSQLAEVQKRLDQSMERLEALKAIERSLGTRPGPGRHLDRSAP